jgi:hypothetical protein
LRSNIPRSALCATLDTYNLIFNFQGKGLMQTYWLIEERTKGDKKITDG